MPKCLTLPSADQVLDRSGNILDRHFGIDAVLIEQIDGSLFRRFSEASATLRILLRTAVQSDLLAALDLEAELCGDDNAVAERRQRLADHSSLVNGP